MKKIYLLIFIFCSQAFAESLIEKGKRITLEGNKNGALACLTCHLENGEGVQEYGFPYLAGMNSTYLSKQLNDYQGQLKISDVMNPIAKGLSKEDIEAVSEYYASLPIITKAEKSNSPQKLEEGRLIAERGLWNKGIPACYACHGPNVVGVGENFPPLMNQGKIFIIKELQSWQKGTRNNDPGMLMKTVAKKLSQKEIEAVAEYLSSLSPVIK